MVIARARPAAVTLAAALMAGGAVMGVLTAFGMISAAAVVASDFRSSALQLDAPLTDINAVVPLIRATLVLSGFATLALAVFVAIAARGLLRRSPFAYVAGLVLVAASLVCALMSTSITAFGRNVRWTVNIDHASPQLVGTVAQSYTDAMPSWLVGLAGGLTDLQTLGYIAVAVLLLMPASKEYFRTRLTS
jgi:hypothetical protein